ncbi:hypothetical protein [Micromonospora sp. NBC_01638]|uniref:hypothetical protein n=1 Tax=Micromonospora sp. NBC_01638 TaxID=2975982 RepID=UPI00386EA0E5|nr:hypothetical protein OG811_13950 [Micromonospora sp. NBC_01638]
MSTYNIGQANANSMAIGDNAQTITGSGQADPLEQLAAAVGANRDALANPDQVDAALRQLRAMLADGSDPTDVQPLLGLIISNAQQAPAVLAAAAQLK